MTPKPRIAIRLELPLPPSTNALYVNAGKHRVSSPAYTRWKWDAWHAGLIQRKAVLQFQSITGPYRFRIYLPTNLRGDVDNRLKAASDFCVTHAITSDDRECVSATAEKRTDVPSGRCIIEIETAAPLLKRARG